MGGEGGKMGAVMAEIDMGRFMEFIKACEYEAGKEKKKMIVKM